MPIGLRTSLIKRVWYRHPITVSDSDPFGESDAKAVKLRLSGSFLLRLLGNVAVAIQVFALQIVFQMCKGRCKGKCNVDTWPLWFYFVKADENERRLRFIPVQPSFFQSPIERRAADAQ